MSSVQRGLNEPVNGSWSKSLTGLAGALKSASGALGEVLMPRTCPCCAVPVAYGAGSPLCEQCLPQLHSALARVERVQVLQPLDGAVVPEVRAASRYEGMMPRALLALKNAGRTDLLPLLGEGLARSVYELLRAHRVELQSAPGSSISSVGTSAAPVEVLLVPAPSSAQSVRRRGYAPANLLVQEAARQLNQRLPASVRVRAVDVIGYAPRSRRGSGASLSSRVGASLLGASEAKNEQKSLGAVGRAERMHGALRVMEPALCADRVSIICDDVVTTGATASEMVRVLQESGSRVLGVCAVAAVPKKAQT
ncbi:MULTISPECIES: ComF family protein [unclassified Rothia (in: high G+C Gram-positive bacteria)]|uniref:ComF family protein n=1 Tax=unclassified Rothia (in: high G+C Gram-positive bacteria) TaxID=2689056 RepID=UPI0009F5E1FD|nr:MULTISPECIES: ComF family protein [unclassified Rothia (in: high G+C Gram-positive bacteria)]